MNGGVVSGPCKYGGAGIVIDGKSDGILIVEELESGGLNGPVGPGSPPGAWKKPLRISSTVNGGGSGFGRRPQGSVKLRGLLRTYRYRFVSPACNRSGSSPINRPDLAL
jgi:hypothetical protein